jgi:MFS family permease
MQVVAQSHTPAKVGYIHLAYAAAQLGKGISKGELISGQAYLSAALITAVACGAIAARLRDKEGRRRIGAKFFAVFGFFTALLVLWMIESFWRSHRTDEEALTHILKSGQFWAMGDSKFASGIEAAAETNGVAAQLAGRYYNMKRYEKDSPETAVKAYWFGEQAASLGVIFIWPNTNELASISAKYLVEPFEASLKSGKLTPAQEKWVEDKLPEMRKWIEEKKAIQDAAEMGKTES